MISNIKKPKFKKKLWGTEEVIVNTLKYCGKILHLTHRWQCSVHFHKRKDETFYILKGRVKMEINRRQFLLGPGRSVRIRPFTKHRFRAPFENCQIIEFSSHHKESDSYRLIKSCPLERLKDY